MFDFRKLALSLLSLAIAIIIFPHGVIAAEDELETYPLQFGPQELVNQINEPVRSIYLIMAESLADTQADVLAKAMENPDECLSNALYGFSLAAEEYYLKELTYPGRLQDLLDSGYLLPGWLEMGFSFVEFADYTPDSSSLQVVFVPQPIGLVDLIGPPGSSCNVKMRKFTEYSLAISTDKLPELFNDPPKIRTWWFKPFYENGLAEVLHMNSKSPGTAACATCH